MDLALPSSSPSLLSSSPPTSSDNSSFAFLVHSQDTLPRNLPPAVDNKLLVRQRRKRTSAEDQIVLEAEFQKDPKPDKASRRRIAGLVALGDKEVQIWFQNRRQTKRRKTRPMDDCEPGDIIQVASSQSVRDGLGDSLPDSDEVSVAGDQSRQSQDCSDIDAAPSEGCVNKGAGNVVEDVETRPSSVAERNTLIVQNEASTSPAELLPQEMKVDATESQLSSTVATQEDPSALVDAVQTNATYDFSSSAATYTSRPSQPLAVLSCSGPTVSCGGYQPLARDTLLHPSPGTQRKRSRVRLSMTMEGQAKIITGEDSSPSPPKKWQQSVNGKPRPALRRSQSAVGLGDSAAHGTGTLKRMPSGRSRDSRAWEFWCDGDSKSDLVKKADQESSGSAADAISLMRSSSRSALAPVPNRQTSRMPTANQAPAEPQKRIREGLVRATSTGARLQSNRDRSMPSSGEERRVKVGHLKRSQMSQVQHARSDSDKENDDPDGRSFVVSSTLVSRTSAPAQRSSTGSTVSTRPQAWPSVEQAHAAGR
ncbi:hypothetical protein MRB53_037545 [Persea americana]|nr:hypothetical protein MRB53_037545 [Persea americana]